MAELREWQQHVVVLPYDEAVPVVWGEIQARGPGTVTLEVETEHAPLGQDAELSLQVGTERLVLRLGLP